MESSTSKTTLKDVANGVLFFVLFGAFVFFLSRSPKDSDWIYYSTDGETVQGVSYERCKRRFTNDYGKCHYFDILSGADVYSTTRDPELEPNIDGVFITQYTDGRCQVFAKNGRESLRIRRETGQSSPGSARLSAEDRTATTLITFTVEKSMKSSNSLSYREPSDFVRWKVETHDGRPTTYYGGTGWEFSEEEDQIVGVGLSVDGYSGDDGVISMSEKGFEDRSRVEAHEKGVITNAFAWRDQERARFSSSLNVRIPMNCNRLIQN